MPTPLPARNIFDGTATPRTDAMKASFGALRDYLAGLLGTTGAASDALAALSPTLASLSAGTTALSCRNKLINGNFAINQRGYVSGAAVGSGLYGHDRWKMAASGDIYTFATVANVTTITIPAGKVLRQVIEGANLQSGTHTLSWTGTAQGKIGAGSYGASGVTGPAVGGTDLTIEFGPGTLSIPQFEVGSVATPLESIPFGHLLALCQRYCRPVVSSSCPGQAYTTTQASCFSTGVPMRVTPTLSTTIGFQLLTANGSAATVTSIGPSAGTTDGTVLLSIACSGGGLVAGNSTYIVNVPAGAVLSAEL